MTEEGLSFYNINHQDMFYLDRKDNDETPHTHTHTYADIYTNVSVNSVYGLGS